MKTHTATGIIRKTLLSGIIATGLMLPAGSAYSSSGTTNEYVFSYSQTQGFPDQGMGRLSIFESGADTVWTLSANWSDQYNASSPFVFSLNYTMLTGSIAQPSLPLFDVIGSVGVKSFGSAGVYFQSSNSTNRFTDGESASWRFLDTTPAQFADFELHINSIYNGSSVKFTPSAVPEPSTYLLFGIGALVSLAAYRRMKTSSRRKPAPRFAALG